MAKKKKTNKLRSLLDGSLLTNELVTNQVPFFTFLMLIAFFYIWNRYNTESIVREIVQTQKEIKELRSESISIESELMFLGNQTEIIKLVKQKGLPLNESLEPPQIIEVQETNETAHD
ncbi:MAG: hypothetical protein CSA05_00705 [Bacteroidia bacterium]|nr:MAG: hypothetical protein CSB01_00460 [Bacteroidia bacterium]PIE86417.1 MAG: hypothetical protein CSA05_00705 [Bacteroidia bacterium]